MGYPNSPGWKRSGPSREAARRITPKAKRLLDRVEDVFKANYPVSYTADQIAERLGESILSVRPRVAELHRGGKIVSTTARVKNASGMTATSLRWVHPSEECRI